MPRSGDLAGICTLQDALTASVALVCILPVDAEERQVCRADPAAIVRVIM
jgi:hypothetical protein